MKTKFKFFLEGLAWAISCIFFSLCTAFTFIGLSGFEPEMAKFLKSGHWFAVPMTAFGIMGVVFAPVSFLGLMFVFDPPEDEAKPS